MIERRFDWDVKKARKNARRHRVTFEEATTVWDDPHRIEEVDVVHTTEDEERDQVLGLSAKLRLLLVIFTEKDEATIRLISARRANQAEARRYSGEG